MLTHLHWFHCRNCRTYATSPVYVENDKQVCCNSCRGYMRHLYAVPIITAEERALAERGLVFNPGCSREPKRAR